MPSDPEFWASVEAEREEAERSAARKAKGEAFGSCLAMCLWVFAAVCVLLLITQLTDTLQGIRDELRRGNAIACLAPDLAESPPCIEGE